MKIVLKLEEVAIAATAVYVLSQYSLGLPTWLWFILFFTPDVGMLGYLINTRIGAVIYNIFHHRGLALFIATVGYLMHNDAIVAVGTLLFAHASFDRIWGYGLKYKDSFKHTHLGSLEKAY